MPAPAAKTVFLHAPAGDIHADEDAVENRVQAVLAYVQPPGDATIGAYARKFDKIALGTVEISPARIGAAITGLDHIGGCSRFMWPRWRRAMRQTSVACMGGRRRAVTARIT